MRFATMLSFAAIGCAQKVPPSAPTPPAVNRAEVRGQVTLGGNPVVGATLSLTPVGKGDFRPFAVTGPDGMFTFAAPDGVGVPLGSYRVSVLRGIDPGGAAPAASSSIPRRYADAGTSGLVIAVTASPPSNGYNLHLLP